MLAEDQSRLQKIDELYDLRLDQYISLPQVSSGMHWTYVADANREPDSSWSSATSQAVKAQSLKAWQGFLSHEIQASAPDFQPKLFSSDPRFREPKLASWLLMGKTLRRSMQLQSLVKRQ
jgi:hypothetical protein